MSSWGSFSSAGQWTSNESHVIDDLTAAVAWLEEDLDHDACDARAILDTPVAATASAAIPERYCIWTSEDESDADQVQASVKAVVAILSNDGAVAKRCGLWTREEVDSNKPTHVIVSTCTSLEGALHATRVSKTVVLGLLARAAIVSKDWLEACKGARKAVPTSTYEVQVCLVHQGRVN